MFFPLVTEFAGEELALMKKRASSLRKTNLVHVLGPAPLKADSALFRQKSVVKFCPEAMSPRQCRWRRRWATCISQRTATGTRGCQLSGDAAGEADCDAPAHGAEVEAFFPGHSLCPWGMLRTAVAPLCLAAGD